MKHSTLLAGAAIILVANAFALVHAARNRAGSPDAEVVLTNRELFYSRPAGDDDSGVTLQLRWTNGHFLPFLGALPDWLDRQKLQTLGFDCSMDPANSRAQEFYRRERPRGAFVAFEYNGPAWQAWLDAYVRAGQSDGGMEQPNQVTDYRVFSSRLLPIDADDDPVKLRVRHPDRATVLILPVAIAIDLQSDARGPRKVTGRIQEMPSSIHVPSPFADEFRRSGRDTSRFKVRLRYGAALEPWVTGVEFPATP